MRTIVDMFREAARKAGSTAIRCPDGDTTYRDLEQEIYRVAVSLKALGVGPGDRIGFWLPNLRAYIVLFGACSLLGATAVAMNTRFRCAEIEDILRRAQPKLIAFVPALGRNNHMLILDGVAPNLLRGVAALIQCGGGDPVAMPGVMVRQYDALIGPDGLTAGVGGPDSGCAIFTTSGTTSLPKFVLHGQEQVVRHAGDVAAVLEFDAPGTMVMQSLPFCGVFGFVYLMAALHAGAPMTLPLMFDVAECTAVMLRDHVTHVAGGDDMMSRLLDEGDRMTGGAIEPFPALRFCPFAIFNSALADFPRTAYRRGLPLIGPFGMSEVFAFYSLRRPNDPEDIRPLGGGVPVNRSAHVRVRDVETGMLLGHDIEGELEMTSPNLFLGYYGDDDATAAAMTGDGYLRTGDLGITHDDGSFTYLGRLGDVLRLGGFLVSPLEIESHLCTHATVADAQVVAVATPRGNRPVAFVIPEDGAIIEPASLIDHCKQALAGFKVPVRVIAIETFPATESANGTKIQKGALRQLADSAIAGQDQARDRPLDRVPGSCSTCRESSQTRD